MLMLTGQDKRHLIFWSNNFTFRKYFLSKSEINMQYDLISHKNRLRLSCLLPHVQRSWGEDMGVRMGPPAPLAI
jgi:hypothetical protein